MFRTMRKKKNAIGEEAVRVLLTTERRGVLAVNGDDGYPYAVPVNYWYCERENRIYFHGAGAGYKVDCLKRSGKVCFTVYGNETVRDIAWAPYVQSAVVFGRCRLMAPSDETVACCRRFAEKYYPDAAAVEEEMAASGKTVQMFVIDIEHISGKEVQER